MNVSEMTPDQIRQTGLEALIRELGLEGAIRFIQQFDPGRGDYTKERHNWLPDDLDAIMEEMKRMRKEPHSKE